MGFERVVVIFQVTVSLGASISCADIYVDIYVRMVGRKDFGHCTLDPGLWQEAGSPLATLEPCPDFCLCRVLNALVVTGALHTGQLGECCANNSSPREYEQMCCSAI